MISVNIKFDARVALAELGKSDKAIAKANRAAINKTARQARKGRYLPGIAAPTGLPKRAVQRAVVLKTAGRRRDVAIIQASGKRIPIEQWRWRFVPIDATRAYVQVQNDISGQWINAYAFVNPRGSKQMPMTRQPQELLVPGLGMSPRRVFGQFTEQLIDQRDVSELLRDTLFEELKAQGGLFVKLL